MMDFSILSLFSALRNSARNFSEFVAKYDIVVAKYTYLSRL